MRGRKDYMFLQGEMIISGMEKLVEEHLFQEGNMCFLLRETRFFTDTPARTHSISGLKSRVLKLTFLT